MSSHLTAGQRALLRAGLESRQHELARRLEEHLSGAARIEPLAEVREQDADDVPQREGERGLDLALSELETKELGQIGEALRRMDGERYGLCADCEEEIPFDRLAVEPWALRCVACQTRREG
jgi:DnaK suppressor protein